MDILYKIFLDPFVQMGTAPDLFVQTLWEGMVGGMLYALIALGFVLIFKASGVFNFAQGIMVVFAALTLVGLYNAGIPAFLALGLTIAVMFALAFAVERVVLRPLINQSDIILFMATFGLTYFRSGFVLIFKASGVFNFAQGIMVVFAALTLVGLYNAGIPAFLALGLTIAVMFALAFAVERVVLRPLINQSDIILFMATFGLTYF